MIVGGGLLAAVTITLFLVVQKVGDSNGYRFDYQGEKAERSESDTIDEAIRTIEIDNRFGDIRIESTEEAATWRWTVACWADELELAKAFSEEVQIEVKVEDDRQRWHLVLPDSVPELRGVKSNFTLFVPESMNVVVNNRHGDTEVKGTHGENKIGSSFGDVLLTGLGGSLNASNRHGDLTISNCDGNIEASNRFGDIVLENLNGNAKISNAHGDIEAYSISNGATIENSFGEIDARNIDGRVAAKNQHGEINLNLSQSEIESIKATTSHDDIELRLPKDLKPMIVASVQYGEFDNAFEEQEGDAPIIRLGVSHGDVRVFKD